MPTGRTASLIRTTSILGTGELIKLSIYPRARQNPLPMWEVVNSLDSIQHAARQDLGIIMWRPPVAALGQRLRVYRDTLREATGKDSAAW